MGRYPFFMVWWWCDDDDVLLWLMLHLTFTEHTIHTIKMEVLDLVWNGESESSNLAWMHDFRGYGLIAKNFHA